MYRLCAKIFVTTFFLSLLSSCANLPFSSSQNGHKPTPLKAIKLEKKPIIKWHVSHSQQSTKALSDAFSPRYNNGYFYVAWPNGDIKAIDALTGRTTASWHIKKSKLSCGLAVKDHLFFVGTTATEVVAFDSEYNQEIWRKPLTSLLLEQPIVMGDILVTKTSDGRINGFNIADGTLKWSNKSIAPTFMIRSPGSFLALDDSAFLIGLPGGYIQALNTQTGQKIWQSVVALPRGVTDFERAVDVIVPPTLNDRLLYAVAYQTQVACFDIQTGRRLWATKIATRHPVIFIESMVIVSTDDSAVVALDSTNGQELWRLDALQYRNISAPAQLGDTILVVDQYGYSHLIEPRSGKLIGRLAIKTGKLLSAPQSFGQGVLLQSHTGYLMYMVLEK